MEPQEDEIANALLVVIAAVDRARRMGIRCLMPDVVEFDMPLESGGRMVFEIPLEEETPEESASVAVTYSTVKVVN